MNGDSVVFLERRKQSAPIDFTDRRIAERRRQRNASFPLERRGLPAQATTHPRTSIDQRPTPIPGANRNKRNGQRLTPHPPWVTEFQEAVAPYWQAVLDCPILHEASAGTLSVHQMRGWMLELYPFIETFPKWLALNLTKADDTASRSFFIDNIRVEKRHAEQWVYMAKGFGIDSAELARVRPLPEVEAMTHWLWSINSRGSLAEGVAATSYAIEGVTQGIAKRTIQGFPHYEGREGISLDEKAYWWMEAHVSYDDLHPVEALEVIKRSALIEESQDRVRLAAQRSLEYMRLALQTCYTAYKGGPPNSG